MARIFSYVLEVCNIYVFRDIYTLIDHRETLNAFLVILSTIFIWQSLLDATAVKVK